MRIQHNIMAMNAYRNYTTNTSAMQKNLERLSSGFKINRAGDDAAGLAISEKMRAQITGLEVASKNAKDGISLVQTAEGALTEVHDMLNRMVELATQSANGTYSNDTDRVQLQKEMDQLRAEIDRIADSANFNGIQLLDGNMDAGGDTVYTKGLFQFDAAHPAGISSGNITLPEVGQTLGKNTVLHTNGTKGGESNTFSIDLENLSVKAGKTIDITVGDITITVTNGGKTAAAADDIIKAIADTVAGKDTGDITIDFGDATIGTNADTGDKVLIVGDNNTEFKLTASGSRLTFTQVSEDDGIKMPQKVEISDALNPLEVTGEAKVTVGNKGSTTAAASIEIDLTGVEVSGPGKVTIEVFGKKYEIEITQDEYDAKDTTSLDELMASKLKDKIDQVEDADGNKFTASFTAGSAKVTLAGPANKEITDEAFVGDDIEVKISGKESDGSESGTFTVTHGATAAAGSISGRIDFGSASTGVTSAYLPDGGKITFSLGGRDFEVAIVYGGNTTASGEEGVDFVRIEQQTLGTTSKNIDGTKLWENIQNALMAQVEAYNAGDKTETDGKTIDLTKDDITFAHSGTGTSSQNVITVNYTLTPPAAEGGQNFSGDWNASTTVLETKSDGTQDRLASTVFNLSKLTGEDGTISEGTTITIGRDTYTFTYDKSKIGKDGYVVLNGGENPDNLNTIAEKLTAAAKGNTTYTVGHNTETGEITITEIEDQTNFDLTTMEGIEKSLGFKIATTRATDNSKGLTLQIGDTAESYNQLKVNIKDCHVKALGIDQISIANQADAGEAVDAINEAINYVSDVRGTLGATQNRLDHTINNLSVMTENIQDAESTIRDTDIAEEMMSYTKNNILIQAAQAMLAQANQVPQGVLQLLQ